MNQICDKGFSVIELLATQAVLAVVFTLGVPSIVGWVDKPSYWEVDRIIAGFRALTQPIRAFVVFKVNAREAGDSNASQVFLQSHYGKQF